MQIDIYAFIFIIFHLYTWPFTFIFQTFVIIFHLYISMYSHDLLLLYLTFVIVLVALIKRVTVFGPWNTLVFLQWIQFFPLKTSLLKICLVLSLDCMDVDSQLWVNSLFLMKAPVLCCRIGASVPTLIQWP